MKSLTKIELRIEQLKEKYRRQFATEFRKKILPLLQEEEKQIKAHHKQLTYLYVGNGSASFSGKIYDTVIEQVVEFNHAHNYEFQERIENFLNVVANLQYGDLRADFENNQLQ